MSEVELGKCKNCGHDIIGPTKGWEHLKHSEKRRGPLDQISNCCIVDGCKCCNPEPK